MALNLKSLTEIANIATGAKRHILTLPIGDVVSKEQVRKKFQGIEELAASMKAEGQQSPIHVSPKNSDGKYVIQKGERRWRALNAAGIPTIDVIVQSSPQSRIDEVAGELIENIQRDDLKALEIADGIGVLLDEGLTRKEISERLGKSASYVSIMLSLRKLPAPVRTLYDKDIVTDPHVLYTLKQIFDEEPAFAAKVCNQARKQGGLSRAKARELLTAIKSAGQDDDGQTPDQAPSEPGQSAQAAQAPTSAAPESQNPAAAGSGAAPSAPEAHAAQGSDAHDAVAAESAPGEATPASPAATAPAALDAPSQAARPTAVAPVQIRVEVDTPQGDVIKGALMLDRADPDAKYGWIEPDGEGEPLRAEVAWIRIVEVRAMP